MPNDLEEALLASGATALVQKEIDPVLLEYMRRYSPVVRALPTVKWGSTTYFFNQRTNLPAGGFVSDGGARPVSTSTYIQNQFPMRQFQVVGAVTGYAEAVTADLIGSLRAKEIQGAHQGLLWDIETAIEWGNSAATSVGPYPQFDGLDTIAATFSGDSQNAINLNQQAFDLGTLDSLIDIVEQNAAMPVETSDWMFIASPTLNSRIAQLLTNQQRFVDQVEVAPGLIVASYRNVPIVKSSFLSPRSDVVGTVTAAAAGSGSSFAGGQVYYYRVSAIQSRFGEIQASAEVSVTPSAGQNVTLSFTPPTGPDNGTPISYKVYRSTSSGGETLLGYVDGAITATLNPDGSPASVLTTTSIVDNGTVLIPQNGTTQPGTLPPAYVPNTGLQPLGAGDQNIYLLSRDPDFVVRPYIREMVPVDLYPTTAVPDALPFAIVDDCTFAVRGPKYLARAANVNITLAT